MRRCNFPSARWRSSQSWETFTANFHGKKRVSVHSLRHSCAMELLHSGVDRAVIALWLGHESVETTYIYLHADLTLKEQAMARTTPSHMPPARYRPEDDVLAFLNSL